MEDIYILTYESGVKSQSDLILPQVTLKSVGSCALADAGQKVDEIRILMGDTTSLQTNQAFEAALGTLINFLDQSLEKRQE